MKLLNLNLQLKNFCLKNFRCFNQLNIEFSSSLVLIEGENGSGKTSILEALSYLCFLRSFRTHITKDLVNENSDNFFIKLEFFNFDNNEIQVGFSKKKKIVKINGKIVQSYKDILTHYRTISLTENDLELINGGPEGRRIFIDQHIMLINSSFLYDLKKYKQILENRNALLQREIYRHEDYLLWTRALWEQGKKIQEMRLKALESLKNELIELILPDSSIKIDFKYEFKYNLQEENFKDFIAINSELYINERNYKRTLFGTHLDDFSIIFLTKKARIFASRGQQKLIILLLKIAQIKILSKKGYKETIIFLLDDFMTDFDIKRLENLIDLLRLLDIQLVFTSPSGENSFKKLLMVRNAYIISL